MVIARFEPGPIIHYQYELGYYNEDGDRYWSRKFDDKERYVKIFNDKDVEWKATENVSKYIWKTVKDVFDRKLKEWFENPYD